MNPVKHLIAFGRSRGWWLLLIIAGLGSEALALYYQHVLEEPPCVLCIHVRLWVTAVVLCALLFLLVHRRLPLWSSHLVMAAIGAVLVERSYQLLGNERGFIIGSCGFDLGLPSWFTPDAWWPLLFEVQTTCGYTPVLLFGVTMAEALLVGSALFTLLSLVYMVMAFRATGVGVGETDSDTSNR